MPFLLNPLALVGLVALPLVVAVYLFRNRFRRRTVASLMLWRMPAHPQAGGTRRQRLQWPWVLLLELVVVCLLVWAAAEPKTALGSRPRPMVVVLDDSISMQARGDRDSARERAWAAVEQHLRVARPSSVKIILAGREPRILTSEATASEVRPLLPEWRCLAPTAALDQALLLASQLAQRDRAHILVLTDHLPPEDLALQGGVVWQAVGEPIPNAGFVLATRSPAGDQDRCLVEVLNGSAREHRTTLTVLVGTNRMEQRELVLPPGQRQSLRFAISREWPVLTLRLGPDALAADNEVHLVRPPRPKVRVQLALTNAGLQELLVRAMEATEFYEAAIGSPHLLIHQTSPVTTSPQTWTVHWIQPADALLYTGPFLVDRIHPLTQGLSLQGSLWAAAPWPDPPTGWPLILVGNVPLLTVSETAEGQRDLVLVLDPSRSNVPHTPDWPVLIWNLLHWRATHLPGVREVNATLGREVALHTAGAPLTLRGPENFELTLNSPGEVFLFEPAQPGLYTAQIGTEVCPFAVNLLAPEETDLTGCNRGMRGTWLGEDPVDDPGSSLAWVLGFLAFVGVAGHWFLVATGRAGG